MMVGINKVSKKLLVKEFKGLDQIETKFQNKK